jgi:hypothetical protein
LSIYDFYHHEDATGEKRGGARKAPPLFISYLYGTGLVSDLGVAIPAVHRPILPWLERYFGVLAALGANRREHLPTLIAAATAETVSAAPLLLSNPALGTSLGLVGVAPLSKKLLLIRAEGKAYTAVLALEGLVFV